ncbi:MAG: ABC transporter permease [Chloroflexota bacterium]|nr:ABC transporter permease [Chloroflexota bacterium]MDE2908987.1 ABC transporter permease [Chloroflexota bacterium]
MGKLILERLLTLALKLFGMAVILFVVTQVLPADPAAVAAGTDARPEQIEKIRRELGLDRPFHEQFITYISGLARGDLGKSLLTRRAVSDDLKLRFPATLELAIFSGVVIVIFSVGLGMIAAVKAGTALDWLIRAFVVIGMAIPPFVLALVLQLIFAKWLDLFPLEGRLHTLIAPPPFTTGLYTVDSLLAGQWDVFWMSLRHLALPVAALALGRLAVGARFTRSGMLETLTKPYVRTARAKGLRENRIVVSHAFRNALIPVVTMLGIQIGFLLSGAVLVEVVFTWPGLGRYAVDSVLSFDFYAVIGAALVIAVIFVVSNTIVDLLYTQLDPRISHR